MVVSRYARLLGITGTIAVVVVGAIAFAASTRADAHALVSSLDVAESAAHPLTAEKLEALSHQLQGHGSILDVESVRLAAVGEFSWHFVAVDERKEPCLLSMVGDAEDYVIAATCGSLRELKGGVITLSAEMPSGVSAAVLLPDDHELARGNSMTMHPGANVAFAEERDAAALPDTARFRSSSGSLVEVSLPGAASEVESSDH